jgi:catechol 2,3-dioxygenase-like lactoylglutathione lyase family enzyme
MSRKRFHISISTADFEASVRDYTARLGAKPDVTVQGRYARWRTDLLNFSISCKPDQKGGLVRHIGFEDADEAVFREERDANGITWEYFSEPAQQEEIGKLVEAHKLTTNH